MEIKDIIQTILGGILLLFLIAFGFWREMKIWGFA